MTCSLETLENKEVTAREIKMWLSGIKISESFSFNSKLFLIWDFATGQQFCKILQINSERKEGGEFMSEITDLDGNSGKKLDLY